MLECLTEDQRWSVRMGINTRCCTPILRMGTEVLAKCNHPRCGSGYCIWQKIDRTNVYRVKSHPHWNDPRHVTSDEFWGPIVGDLSFPQEK